MHHRHAQLLTLLAALMLATLVLAGCGEQTPPAADTPQASAADIDRTDPMAVHTAWVQSLDSADLDTAITLAASDDADRRYYFAQRKLEDIQWLKQGKDAQAGAFRSMELLGVRAENGTQVGYSRWSFENVTYCYYDKLRKFNGGWAVDGWYATTEMERCDSAE